MSFCQMQRDLLKIKALKKLPIRRWTTLREMSDLKLCLCSYGLPPTLFLLLQSFPLFVCLFDFLFLQALFFTSSISKKTFHKLHFFNVLNVRLHVSIYF